MTQSMVPTKRTVVTVLIVGCLISLIGFGIRSTFGLFLEPMTVDRGWSRETFALAMAIQNLLWGAGVPIAGALSDRFGPVKVISVGAFCYCAGTLGLAFAESSFALHFFGGILTGFGVSFSAFSLALAAMAKVVGPERRSMALGLGTAAGSFGQVVFSPVTQGFIATFGWSHALFFLATVALSLFALASFLPDGPTKAAGEPDSDQTLREALKEATQHRGYVLLTVGFFVCGFHVAFITVHFPAYVKDLGLDPATGAYALALVGLFNIVGSIGSGILGGKFSKKGVLSII